MYSAFRSPALASTYVVFDPDGVRICTVTSYGEAVALISHLNR